MQLATMGESPLYSWRVEDVSNLGDSPLYGLSGEAVSQLVVFLQCGWRASRYSNVLFLRTNLGLYYNY